MKKVLALLAPAPTFDLSRPLLDLGGCRGPVTQQKSQWVPDINSYGGGGVIYRGTGAILPPTIRTTQIHRQEFMIANQHQYHLTRREDVALAPGHDVGVLCANGIPTQIINYTTGTIYCTAAVWELVPQLPVQDFGAMLRILAWDNLFFVLLILIAVVVPVSMLAPVLHLGDRFADIFFPATFVSAVLLFLFLTWRALYRRWHYPRLNVALRARGREEIVAICRERFDVDPVL